MPADLAANKSFSTTVREKWGWFLILGIVFVIGGVFAIAMPLISSVTVAIFIAIVLVIAGIFQIFQAFSVQGWGGFLWQLVVGIVMLIGGIAIYMMPVTGAVFVTFIIAAVFLAKGIFQIALSFRVRPMDGWGWILAAGIIAFLAGLFILLQYPFSGLWVPGTLAGISLLFTGWSYIALALAARRITA
ncbi:HdeD family acid-resistance protein [Kaistia terrae]|jgi:uncharacterized membrane protein HdeD (DUF308 family)|uniref:HdeD family acid-resistance protein n=1 Tax=Kaistia terrae TaxID=537017 RepID=A0ABW0PUB0_9HYPH|nr:HdeD family acid-resistance protein [Kaistia terrae]MCX5578345.1 HdeD family acid-resistance protein [Kaistia terrae]